MTINSTMSLMQPAEQQWGGQHPSTWKRANKQQHSELTTKASSVKYSTVRHRGNPKEKGRDKNMVSGNRNEGQWAQAALDVKHFMTPLMLFIYISDF